ncbi:Signal transduction histidine kinase [Pseudoalteromonas luteoviolacea B = ATCC 29581]|nr:Signal transduction histidine kinase [Pseudoalteromonas luteoviolacea B = ATCC 29581]
MYRVLWFLLSLLYCVAGFATVDKAYVLKQHGVDRLVALNAYLEEHADVDAEQALSFILELEPSLPIDMRNEDTLRLFAFKANALKFVGEKAQASKLISEVISAAELIENNQVMRKALFYRLVMYFEQSQFELALDDSYLLIELIGRSDSNNDLAKVFLHQGEIFIAQNQFAKAFELQLKALGIFDKSEDKAGLIQANGSIGMLYRNIGDLDNALAYQQAALDAQLALNDEKASAIMYNNTGIIYKDLGRYDKAIVMHRNSLALKQKIGYERGMVYSHNNLGESYRLAGDIERAKKHLQEAEKLANKLNNRMLLGSTFLYQGRIALEEKQFESAEKILTEAMDIYTKRNATARIAEGLVELAKVSLAMNNTVKAQSQLQQAIDFSLNAKKNIVLFEAYELLSDLLAQSNQFDKAYGMLKTYQQSRNQLFDLQSQQRIELLVVANQVKEADRQLQFVQQEAALTEAYLSNKIANRNLMFFVVLFGLLLLWYWYSRQAQKRQLLLEVNARKAIEEKEQQLSLALWGSGDVLWDWDLRSGTITRQNADNLIGAPDKYEDEYFEAFKDYILDEDVPKLTNSIKQLLQGKQEAFEVNYRVKKSDGKWIWVQDRGKIVERGANGRACRIAGIQHDISVLKLQEHELVELNEQLEDRVKHRTLELEKALSDLKVAQESLIESEKMASLGRLVAGVAHEINTPLGTSMMALSHFADELKTIKILVKNNALSKAQLESCIASLDEGEQLVSRGLTKTSRLVEQFKQLAVTSRSNFTSEFELIELLNQALKQARSKSNEPVECQIHLLEYVTVKSDIDALLQVFELLFINAIEHAKNNILNVYVSVESASNKLIFTVQDDGTGFNGADLERLFEPFYTTKRSKGHVGLGLNIVYNLVTQVFHGDIKCQTSRHGGACFVFSIALIDA